MQATVVFASFETKFDTRDVSFLATHIYLEAPNFTLQTNLYNQNQKAEITTKATLNKVCSHM